MNNDLDKWAESVYDYCCANRADNLNKDKTAGDPRKVGCEYKDLFDNTKNFYRNVAMWHLKNK